MKAEKIETRGVSYNLIMPGTVAVLDLETTGLPTRKGWLKYYPSEQLDKYDSSRVVELGIKIYNDEQKVVYEYSSLVKPDNWTIHPKASEVSGITDEMCEVHGIELIVVLDHVWDAIKMCNVNQIVCHNAGFDKYILMSECRRYEHHLTDTLCRVPFVCTMLMGEHVYNLQKCPRLTVLYEMVTGQPCKQTHRAMGDVDLCAQCYFAIRDNQ